MATRAYTTPQQIKLLRALRREGDWTSGSTARAAAGIPSAARTSVLLAQLVKEGHVERNDAPYRSTKTRWRITDAGRAALKP